MQKTTERQERASRAERLVQARKRAGYKGATGVAKALSIDVNRYKAHEAGRNGFGIADAKLYARAFDVSPQWLNFNIGSIDDPYVDTTSEQAEFLNLLDRLPAGLQKSQIENLRALVDALEKQAPSE